MTLIYNYILGYDNSDNTWFHNVDAEADLLNCNTVWNEKYEEYINEYSGDGIYLSDAEQLITKFNEVIELLNQKEIEEVKKKMIRFNEALDNVIKDRE
jgi:alpha-glucuronidase